MIKVYGIPRDGGKPFLMFQATLNGEPWCHKNVRLTRELYLDEVIAYEFHMMNGEVKRFEFIDGCDDFVISRHHRCGKTVGVIQMTKLRHRRA